MRKLKGILTIAISLILLVATFSTSSVSKQEKIPVIIGFKEKPDKELVKAHKGEIKYVYTLIPAIAAKVPADAIDALGKHIKVAYIEKDEIVQALQLTQTTPWGITKIRARNASLRSNVTGGLGINISVLDTGIGPHGDLIVRGGINFTPYAGPSDQPSYSDDNGHGTHVAGIIAALNNNMGVVGVAPNASLYSVKVLNQYGWGYYSDLIAGIQWSVDNNMKIISMSLGGYRNSKALKAACNTAYNYSKLLVAAAGNESQGRVLFPAKYDSVIAVVATDSADERAWWNNFGKDVELAAPGVNINSTYRNLTYIGYISLSGTSMAVPHVSGTAALIWKKYPSYLNTQVRNILRSMAVDLGASGWDRYYGYGRIDAYNATS